MNKSNKNKYHIPGRRQFTVSPRVLWSVIILLIVGALAGCGEEKPQNLATGKSTPDFTLPATNGEDVSLIDFKGKQPVLLYFHMAVG